jgi:hypothetical protein
MTKYTRDELLIFKEKFTEKPIHFESIHDIFNMNSNIVSKFWKPNNVITSEQEKVKKHSFNILNKLSLENFSNLTKSLITLLQQTNDEMIKMFIKQMINKCANEKTYISLYVELYTVLKNNVNYFHEYFLETLQQLYESFEGDKAYRFGLLTLIINMYNKGIIKEYIIHQCLKQYFEKKMFEDICILFTSCGKNLDHQKAKDYNKTKYFDLLEKEANNKKNGMRICFKIQDLLKLYQNNWVRI